MVKELASAETSFYNDSKYLEAFRAFTIITHTVLQHRRFKKYKSTIYKVDGESFDITDIGETGFSFEFTDTDGKKIPKTIGYDQEYIEFDGIGKNITTPIIPQKQQQERQ